MSINPDKPRKGAFEVRSGDKTFCSLLDMPRPFTKLKASVSVLLTAVTRGAAVQPQAAGVPASAPLYLQEQHCAAPFRGCNRWDGFKPLRFALLQALDVEALAKEIIDALKA